MVSGQLQATLERGEMAVTAEIGPERAASGDRVRKHAVLLRDHVDAINLTDNQSAVVRLSSWAASLHVLAEGAEPILQMTTRDRNRLALQSDLLGAVSLGLRNVLCLTGDHQSLGDHPTAKNVFDVDSIQLLAMLRRMRDEGVLQNGEALKYPLPPIYLGAVENPFAEPLAYRVTRLAKKIRAGAQFLQTQVIFDRHRFRAFMAEVRAAGLDSEIHILGGITPPRSARALRYMSTVPGIRVPDELIRRMEAATDQREEGVQIALEIARDVLETPGVHGVHVMAIMGEETVPRLVEEMGLYPRPR